MSESPARQSVVVGVFVAIGAALFAGGVLTVGSLTGSFRKTATIHAVFDDVQGLEVASDVQFSGVKVGTVRAVRFHDGAQVAVDLAVGQDVLPHVPGDTKARIASNALLGEAIVILEDGTPGAPPLTDGQAVATLETPTTEDVFATLQENNQNLLAVTENLKSITAEITAGRGTVGRLLSDDELYADLREGVSSLRAASGEARAFASTLSDFAEELDTQGTSASLARSVQNIEEVTTRATEVTGDLERRVSSTDSAIGVLLSDEEAAADLKSTIDELERGTRLLSEDLEALQHNFLLRGYFKKRDKERSAPEEQQPAPEPEPEEPSSEANEPPPPVSARGS